MRAVAVSFLLVCCMAASFSAPSAALADIGPDQGTGPSAVPPQAGPAPRGEPFTPSPDVMQMTDIIDIKPVMHPGMGIDWALVWMILGLAAAAALAFLLLRRYFRRSDAGMPVPEPHEQAFAALEQLPARRLDSRLYYFALSEIARRYVEDRFEVPALEMTSEELLLILPDLPLEQVLRDRVARMVRRWDMARYAGVAMDEERRERDRLLVREVVAMTVPVSGEDGGDDAEPGNVAPGKRLQEGSTP